MAFCSKVGSIMRHSLFGNAIGAGHIRSMSSVASNRLFIGGSIMRHSLFGNALGAGHIRSMSSVASNRLFIGGLAFGTDDLQLKEAFASFGDVVDARVITDRDTGRSRGFGFVNFADEDSAKSALEGMDGQELNGRNIRVSYANEKTGGGGGGGFRGGFGGNGGYRGRGGGSAGQDEY